MVLDVTVVIATYGDESWLRLAHHRPIPSVEALGVPYIYRHEPQMRLHEVRNAALDEVTTEWVIHLDGDDQLDRGYIDAMATGTADVRAPSVVYVPRFAPARVPKAWGHQHDTCTGDCLRAGNWLVIGAMLRTDLAQRVRWRDWPVYEDYDFWLRCYLAGATFEAIPSAVYRAWSRRGGRNTSLPLRERNEIHRQIAAATEES